MNRIVKMGVALVILGGVGVATVQLTDADPRSAIPAIQRNQAGPATAAVATLVDGESFDVRADGQITTIRLLNISTPVPATQDRPAQCLGPDASAFLATVIPVGTGVILTYDNDQFGRPAASASTADGKLVNAEIVGAGLAEVVATDDGTATPTLQAVRVSAQEAAAKRLGLHSPDVACTVPGQVKAVVDMAAKVPTVAPPGARGADLHNLASAATDGRVAADRLVWAFQENRQDLTWRVLDPSERAQLEQQATQARDKVAAAEIVLRGAANGAFNAESTQVAVQAEAARIAHQLAAIRKAEARRAAMAAKRAKAAADAAHARQDADRSKRDSNRRSGRDSRDNSRDRRSN
jgi:micrococcal nuclease